MRKAQVINDFETQLLQIIKRELDRLTGEAAPPNPLLAFCVKNKYPVHSIILTCDTIKDKNFQIIFHGWLAMVGAHNLTRLQKEEYKKIHDFHLIYSCVDCHSHFFKKTSYCNSCFSKTILVKN